MNHMKVMIAAIALSIAAAGPSAISAAEKPLNPKAISIKLPDQIPWVRNAAGTAETAILYGDPKLPGLYVVARQYEPSALASQ
jgi:hypothetical protein